MFFEARFVLFVFVFEQHVRLFVSDKSNLGVLCVRHRKRGLSKLGATERAPAQQLFFPAK